MESTQLKRKKKKCVFHSNENVEWKTYSVYPLKTRSRHAHSSSVQFGTEELCFGWRRCGRTEAEIIEQNQSVTSAEIERVFVYFVEQVPTFGVIFVYVFLFSSFFCLFAVVLVYNMLSCNLNERKDHSNIYFFWVNDKLNKLNYWLFIYTNITNIITCGY